MSLKFSKSASRHGGARLIRKNAASFGRDRYKLRSRESAYIKADLAQQIDKKTGSMYAGFYTKIKFIDAAQLRKILVVRLKSEHRSVYLFDRKCIFNRNQ